MKKEITDVLVVGGGASGMMAAIWVKRKDPSLNVTILESSFALGRKLLISGAGRGNVLNTHLAEKDITKYYHTNNKELISEVFSKFGYQSIYDFFIDLGINLYEEEKNSKGKLFPVCEQARNVLKILEEEIMSLGIKVLLKSKCTMIYHDEGLFSVNYLFGGSTYLIHSKKLILASGGKSYPSTGSDGSGYKFLEDLGHNIFPLVPVNVPLLAKDEFIKMVVGSKIKAKVSSFFDEEFEKEVTDDLLFTSYGLSGSSILALSRDIAMELIRNKRSDIILKVNFLPNFTKEELIERFIRFSEAKLAINLYGLLPQKIVDGVLYVLKISKDVKIKDMNIEERKKLFDLLYEKQIAITGSRGWNDAEFTAGGLDASEVDPRTLGSIITPGLFICGEVLNVDGEIGGFNLAWAWASGFVAGSSAVK